MLENVLLNSMIADYWLNYIAMSDMHALDAQYHRKCLVALYNHMQQYSSHSNINPGHDCFMSEQAVALAELATYIEESAQNNSMTSVFKLSDLAKLYIILNA